MENSESTFPNYDNIFRGTDCIFISNIIPVDSIHIVNYIIEPILVENIKLEKQIQEKSPKNTSEKNF